MRLVGEVSELTSHRPSQSHEQDPWLCIRSRPATFANIGFAAAAIAGKRNADEREREEEERKRSKGLTNEDK
jgi:hypothetical protein